MNNNTVQLPEDLKRKIEEEAEKWAADNYHTISCTAISIINTYSEERVAFIAGATQYALEVERLKELFKDLLFHCNKQGKYDSTIQDMIAKVLQEGKGGKL